MPFSAELFIGLRHLRARSNLAFVSLTTWISVLGIALGVATLIVVVGVMTGFQREFREKILGTQSHIVIVKSDAASMREWRDVLKRVRGQEGVAAASPFVYGQAMFSSGGRVMGSVVRGGRPFPGSRRDGHQQIPEGRLAPGDSGGGNGPRGPARRHPRGRAREKPARPRGRFGDDDQPRGGR